MKESWILSEERLRDWVDYAKSHPHTLKEEIGYVLDEMSTSKYPNDVSHLERMMQLHKEAANMLTSVLVDQCFASIHYDLYSARDSWILTKEKIEEIFEWAKKEEMNKILDFFYALNYRIYLKSWESGFIEINEKTVKMMQNEHQTAIGHLEKAIKNRRIRTIVNK